MTGKPAAPIGCPTTPEQRLAVLLDSNIVRQAEAELRQRLLAERQAAAARIAEAERAHLASRPTRSRAARLLCSATRFPRRHSQSGLAGWVKRRTKRHEPSAASPLRPQVPRRGLPICAKQSGRPIS
jgi:hypothetical protein